MWLDRGVREACCSDTLNWPKPCDGGSTPFVWCQTPWSSCSSVIVAVSVPSTSSRMELRTSTGCTEGVPGDVLVCEFARDRSRNREGLDVEVLLMPREWIVDLELR